MQLLYKKGPQTPDKIEMSINAKADMTKKCLNILIKQRLIEKTTNHNNQKTCSNTDRGKRVLEFFHVKF